MEHIYKLREEDKCFFRKKFGLLLNGDQKKLVEKVKRVVNNNRLYCVGDRASHTFIKNDIKPDLFIWDGKIEREKKNLNLDNVDMKCYNTVNPSGMITKDAFYTVKEAMQNLPAKIKVDGEEDLLAACVIYFGENGDYVTYGMPEKGLVLAKITQDLKDQFDEKINFDTEN